MTDQLSEEQVREVARFRRRTRRMMLGVAAAVFVIAGAVVYVLETRSDVNRLEVRVERPTAQQIDQGIASAIRQMSPPRARQLTDKLLANMTPGQAQRLWALLMKHTTAQQRIALRDVVLQRPSPELRQRARLRLTARARARTRSPRRAASRDAVSPRTGGRARTRPPVHIAPPPPPPPPAVVTPVAPITRPGEAAVPPPAAGAPGPPAGHGQGHGQGQGRGGGPGGASGPGKGKGRGRGHGKGAPGRADALSLPGAAPNDQPADVRGKGRGHGPK